MAAKSRFLTQFSILRPSYTHECLHIIMSHENLQFMGWPRKKIKKKMLFSFYEKKELSGMEGTDEQKAHLSH